MDSYDILAKTKEVLARHAERIDLAPANIPDSQPIFGPSGLVTDSLRILEALVELEETFDVTIPDEDLTEDLFASVGSFAKYVARRQSV